MVWTLDKAIYMYIVTLVEITLFSQCFSSPGWWYNIDCSVEPYGRLGYVRDGERGEDKHQPGGDLILDLSHT